MSNYIPQDIPVRVVPGDDGITLEVTADLPAGHEVLLKTVIIAGAGELGPSDHVPSYSDFGPGRRIARFEVPVPGREAFGCLFLHRNDGVAWTGVFHRMPLTGDQTAYGFVDRVCTLEVNDAPETDAVILRQESAAGPDGGPCYAYSVTGQSTMLDESSMTLRLSVASHPNRVSLIGFWKSGAMAWSKIDNSELLDDRRELRMPISVDHLYAIGAR